MKVIEELQKVDGLPGVTTSEIQGFGKGKAREAKDKVKFEMAKLFQRIQLEAILDAAKAD